MRDTAQSEVYRIALNGRVCRSGFSLLNLNVAELNGVSAVTCSEDGTLVVMAPSGADIYDDLVGAVIDSGFDPLLVTVAELERIIDPAGLSLDDAMRLGLIEPPKEPVRAKVETVQRVCVSVTDGYDPDTIIIAAGMPAEIEFSEGHGCLGRLVFDALGIDVDLEAGGAVVKLPALDPGTYGFRCGMDMVHGTLIAE